jgi:hypothetical protein
MVVMVMVMVMDDHLIVPSHFMLSHFRGWYFRKGWDSEAKRNAISAAPLDPALLAALRRVR